MKCTLDNLFQVILPDIPPALVGPQSLEQIRRRANALPPIYRGGLECRLATAEDRVDLHQCISGKDNEPGILLDHISSSPGFAHPAWTRVADFCGHWSRPLSLLADIIEYIWLEIDIVGPDLSSFVPSVFITLSDSVLSRHSQKEVENTVKTALELLKGQRLSAPLKDNIRRCSDACPRGGSITHLGMMLSRNSDVMSVVVDGLTPDQLPYYLQRIGWPGSMDEDISLFNDLGGIDDRAMFALDIGEKIGPKIGMECSFSGDSEGTAEWIGFLDYLTERDLCTVEKRDALMAWAGFTNPISAFERWPDHLALESLLRPPSQFTLFNRQVSHVKIVIQPGRPIEAKAYLWFGHEWANLGAPEKHCLESEAEATR